MFKKGIGVGKLLLGLVACTAPLVATNDEQSKTPPRDDSKDVKVSHPSRIRLGGISVGASYSRFSGPYWGWPYSCGPYGYRPLFWNAYGPYCAPFFDLYSPFLYHSGYYSGFPRGPNMGEVRLHSDSKRAEVFLDEAYAGVAEDLKSIWLEPGAYNLEVRADRGATFSRRIYVLSGKTLKIEATPQSRDRNGADPTTEVKQ